MIVLNCDPGGRHFAMSITEIKNKETKIKWFGYHPMVQYFNFEDAQAVNFFRRSCAMIAKRCDELIVERYITRQAVRGVSPEKIILMIGFMTEAFLNENKWVTPITSTVWKNRYNTDEIKAHNKKEREKAKKKNYKMDLVKGYNIEIDRAKEIGYLKTDKHLVDCILMHCVVKDIMPQRERILKSGLKIYAKLKEKEKLLKSIMRLPIDQQKNCLDRLANIEDLKMRIRERKRK